jgi:tetratricopeptide (TPR) repeat protein
MLQKEPERRYSSMEEVGRDIEAIHDALRRSHSRSAIPHRAAPAAGGLAVAEDVRARVRDLVARGRAHYDGGQYAKALFDMKEALALDPTSAEAAEVLWRAGKRLQESRPRGG